MQLDLGQALEVIGARRVVGRPTVIAIDGRSGVGKSTFAAGLAPSLSAAIVEGDDFFAGGIAVRTDTPAERVESCIDWRRQRAVIDLLRRNQPASWHRFDWESFNGDLDRRQTTCEPAWVVLLEGVYSGRPELADLVDVRILLSLPDDVRLARLRDRDGPIEDWARQWHEAEEHYFSEVAPRDGFDLVLDGA